MTQFLNEPEQPETGMTWGKLFRLGLLTDFRETLSGFWGGTVSPVFRLLSQTISILWGHTLVPAIGNWLAQVQSRLRDFGSLKTRKRTQESATSESLNMRRIQGALGERWSFASGERPIRVNGGKQNPWISAETRMQTLAPERKAGKILSNQPRHEEEIRGLDDIFVGPVYGSFLDVLNKPGTVTSPAKAKPESKLDLAEADPFESLTLFAEEDDSVSPADEDWQLKPEWQAIAAGDSFSSTRMQNLAQTQAFLREESRKLGRKVKNIAASTKDWFEKQDAAFSQVDLVMAEKVPVPYVSYVSEEVTTFAPARPVVTRPESAIAPLEVSNNQPELTYQFGDVTDSCDYMFQNNRILANSISNLVDRYFHKAAEEEAARS